MRDARCTRAEGRGGRGSRVEALAGAVLAGWRARIIGGLAARLPI